MTDQTAIPKVVITPHFKIQQWSLKLKIFAAVSILVMYIYLFIVVKTNNMRNERLNHISEMASDTQKILESIEDIDQRIADGIISLNEAFAAN